MDEFTKQDIKEVTLMLTAVRLANRIPLTATMMRVWNNTSHEEHEWAYSMIDES